MLRKYEKTYDHERSEPKIVYHRVWATTMSSADAVAVLRPEEDVAELLW